MESNNEHMFEKEYIFNYFPVINGVKYKLHLELLIESSKYFKIIKELDGKIKTDDEIIIKYKGELIPSYIIKECLKDIYRNKLNENFDLVRDYKKYIVYDYLGCNCFTEKFISFLKKDIWKNNFCEHYYCYYNRLDLCYYFYHESHIQKIFMDKFQIDFIKLKNSNLLYNNYNKNKYYDNYNIKQKMKNLVFINNEYLFANKKQKKIIKYLELK